ncbi:uncharacterized protein METZ01_LOCUS474859, partial [marine metagenome]
SRTRSPWLMLVKIEPTTKAVKKAFFGVPSPKASCSKSSFSRGLSIAPPEDESFISTLFKHDKKGIGIGLFFPESYPKRLIKKQIEF